MAATAENLDGYAAVLRETTTTLDAAGIPYVVFGSIATRAAARPGPFPTDEDIDLFLRPPDVAAAVRALEGAGFVTQEHDPAWIHKAMRGGVTVDLIFRAGRHIYLDDEMLERAVTTEAFGVPVKLMPPEDLAIIKAVLHEEDRTRDWFDALSILERNNLDWDYLVRRARSHAAQRVLSLLIYAGSNGVAVPEEAIFELKRATG
ncbi:MAG TPA: nucleotidyltransferase [Actinomycetota bacterium]|nr:nucleotidyltransferase [Actinomycetota bacterium]